MKIGDYNLIEQIGAGGMGQVWLAENIHTRMKYAIKLLPQQATREGNFVARFFDEGRVMAQMEHPHIVRVHHVGQDGEQYFLVMDYIEGPGGKPQSLHDLLQSRPQKRLTEDEARTWALQLAQGLAYAHEQGVVHRDIKPANIMVDPDGNVRITDFGLAKAVGEEFLRTQIHQSIQSSLSGHRALHTLSDQATIDSGHSSRSTAESLLGTYDYMSPEQRGDLPGVTLGPASDVYSFGVMLYRLLTGRRPTGRAKAVSQTVTGLSKHWDPIVDRCLEHEPRQRYREGSEMLAALQASWGTPAPVTKRPLWGLALATVVLALLATGYLLFRQQDRSDVEPEPRSSVSENVPQSSAEPGDRMPLQEPATEPIPVIEIPSPVKQEEVTVVETTVSPKPVQPPAARGEIWLTSTPGVTVRTQDTQGQQRILGKTDAQGQLRMTELPPGRYGLSLSLENYQAGTTEVIVGAGQALEIDHRLQPLPGRLKFSGREDLAIYQGGVLLGRGNMWVDLPAGQHELELRCSGYRNQSVAVEVPPNQSVVKQAPMLAVASGDITIRLSSTLQGDTYLGNQTGRVRLNGGDWKTVKFPYQEVGLPCRQHRIECQVEGYVLQNNASDTLVEVMDRSVRDITLMVTPQAGSVTVRSAAPEAQVCDAQGERLGFAGDKLSLAPFTTHTLTVKAPGFVSGSERTVGRKRRAINAAR